MYSHAGEILVAWKNSCKILRHEGSILYILPLSSKNITKRRTDAVFIIFNIADWSAEQRSGSTRVLKHQYHRKFWCCRLFSDGAWRILVSFFCNLNHAIIAPEKDTWRILFVLKSGDIFIDDTVRFLLQRALIWYNFYYNGWFGSKVIDLVSTASGL